MNSLVSAWRRKHPDDNRPDDAITIQLGKRYREMGVDLDDLPEDFKEDYLDYERMFRPGKIEEGMRGLARGVDTLQGTAYGAVGLAGDVIGDNVVGNAIRDFGVEGYKRNMREAQENAPSIRTYKDVESVGDAFQFGSGLVGEAMPSLLESIGTGLVGAAAGSTVGPAGTIGGAITGFGSKAAIRGMIKQQIRSKLGREVGEELIEDAMQAKGKKEIFKRLATNLSKEGIKEADDIAMASARKAAAASAGTRAVVADSMFQNTGATYGELSETDVDRSGRIVNSLLGGSAAGALDAALPATVLGRLFGGRKAATSIMEKAQARVFGKPGTMQNFFTTVLRDTGVEGGTEALQELIQETAVQRGIHGNLDDAIAAIDPEEMKERMINAALAGMAGGGTIGTASGVINTVNSRGELEQRKIDEDDEKALDRELNRARKNLEKVAQVKDTEPEPEPEPEVPDEPAEPAPAPEPETPVAPPVAPVSPEPVGPTTPPVPPVAPVVEPSPIPEEPPPVNEPEPAPQPAPRPNPEPEIETPVPEPAAEPEAQEEPAVNLRGMSAIRGGKVITPQRLARKAFTGDEATILPQMLEGTGEQATTPAGRRTQALFEAFEIPVEPIRNEQNEEIETVENEKQIRKVLVGAVSKKKNKKTWRNPLEKFMPEEQAAEAVSRMEEAWESAKQRRTASETKAALALRDPEGKVHVLGFHYQNERGNKRYKVVPPDANSKLVSVPFSEIKDGKAERSEDFKGWTIIDALKLPEARKDHRYTYATEEQYNANAPYDTGERRQTQAEVRREQAINIRTSIFESLLDNGEDEAIARRVADEAATEDTRKGALNKAEDLLRQIDMEVGLITPPGKLVSDLNDIMQGSRTTAVSLDALSENAASAETEAGDVLQRTLSDTDDEDTSDLTDIGNLAESDIDYTDEQVDAAVRAVREELEVYDPNEDSLEELLEPLFDADPRVYAAIAQHLVDAGQIVGTEDSVEAYESVISHLTENFDPDTGFSGPLGQVQAKVSTERTSQEAVRGADKTDREQAAQEEAAGSQLESGTLPKENTPAFGDNKDGTPGDPPMPGTHNPADVDANLELARKSKLPENIFKARQLATQFAESLPQVSDQGVLMVERLFSYLERANPEAVSELTLEVGESDRAGSYDWQANTIFISSTAENDMPVNALLHEAGHFALNLLDVGELLLSWQGLTDRQRVKAYSRYLGRALTDQEKADLTNLATDTGQQAMAEWAAMTFHRVALDSLANTDKLKVELRKEGIPETFVDRFIEFARELKQMVTSWIGPESISTREVDQMFESLFSGEDLRTGLSDENVAALDSLSFAPSKPTYERRLLNGMSRLSGMENPKLYLDNAAAAWNQVSLSADAVWASVLKRLEEDGVAVEYDAQKFLKMWSEPQTMMSHITGRADEMNLQLDPLDYDTMTDTERKRVIAFIAAQELQYIRDALTSEGTRVEKNIARVKDSIRRLEKRRDEGRADQGERVSLGQFYRSLEGWRRKQRFINETKKGLYYASEQYVADLQGTHLYNIGNGTHIAVPKNADDEAPGSVEFNWDNGELVLGVRERDILAKQWDWLQNPANKGRDPFTWNLIKSQYVTLGKMAQQKLASNSQNLLFGWFRPLAQRLKELGHPAAADASRQQFLFQSIYDSNRNRAEALGRKSDAARYSALESLGFKERVNMWDAFAKLIDTPAKRYLEQQGGTLDGMVRHLRIINESDSQLSELLENDKAVKALKAYMEAEMESTKFFRKMAETYTSVTDSRIRMPDPTNPNFDPEDPWKHTKSIERPPLEMGTGTFMVTSDVAEMSLFVDVMRKKSQTGGEDSVALFQLKPELLDERSENYDPEKYMKRLVSALSDPEVQNRFLSALVFDSKVSNFVDAQGLPLEPEFVIQAWENNQAAEDSEQLVDVPGFLEDITEGDTAALLKNVKAMREMLAQAITLVDEHEEQTHVHRGTNPHVGIDARIRDRMPAGWLKYRQFGGTANRHLLANVAFHGSFGKDGKMWDERIKSTIIHWRKVEKDFQRVAKMAGIDRLRGAERRQAMLEKVKPEYRGIMETAFKGKFAPWATGRRTVEPSIYAQEKIKEAEKIDSQFKLTFQSELGPMREASAFLEFIQLLAAGALNGPRSAFVQFNSLYFPSLFYGRNAVTASQIYDSGKETVRTIFGSFLSAFDIEMRMSERTRERRQRLIEVMGETPDKGLGLRDHFRQARADVGPNGQMADQPIRRGLRGMSAMLSRGVSKVSADKTALFPSFNPLAPFRTAITGITDGAILSTWKSFDDLAERAIEYVKDNRDRPTSDKQSPFHPDFAFTPDMLGYKSGFFFDSSHAFKAMNSFLKGEVGTTLEQVALTAVQKESTQPYTNQQYSQLAQVALGYITSESSQFTTRPDWMKNTAIGRIVSPLMGWTMQQPNNFARMFKDPDTMQATYKTIANGMLTFATAALPFTIAFSLFMDWFDEGVLGKKSSMRKLSMQSSLGQNALAVSERFSRWGPMGLPAEGANLLFNIGGGGGDVRDLSLDQRVLFANSVRGVLGSIGSWINQGQLIPNYASVVRPMMMSLGLNGPLQVTQMVSNMTGLDNLETRVNRRTNANNWLRSSGRILGLEVRTYGGSFTPTQATPHLTNMALSAMANDRAGFRKAYRKALDAAVEMGKPDPEQYVKQSFATRHPLKSVFKKSPSQQEYRELLDVMKSSMPGSNGDRDVTEAIRLFNAYAAGLGITPYEGKEVEAAPVSLSTSRVDPYSISTESINPYF